MGRSFHGAPQTTHDVRRAATVRAEPRAALLKIHSFRQTTGKTTTATSNYLGRFFFYGALLYQTKKVLVKVVDAVVRREKVDVNNKKAARIPFENNIKAK